MLRTGALPLRRQFVWRHPGPDVPPSSGRFLSRLSFRGPRVRRQSRSGCDPSHPAASPSTAGGFPVSGTEAPAPGNIPPRTAPLPPRGRPATGRATNFPHSATATGFLPISGLSTDNVPQKIRSAWRSKTDGVRPGSSGGNFREHFPSAPSGPLRTGRAADNPPRQVRLPPALHWRT